MKRVGALALGFATLLLASNAPAPSDPLALEQIRAFAAAPPQQLSAWKLFDSLQNRTPAAALVGYEPTMQLFSDYALKQRYIYVPADSPPVAPSDGNSIDPDKIQFPQGAVLVKSFGYAQADGGQRPLETRLLVQGANGWVPLTYVWRADGSDADLRLGGQRLPVRFTDPSGAARDVSYAVPNRNQCKECHGLNGAVEPLGPRTTNISFANNPSSASTLARLSLPQLQRRDANWPALAASAEKQSMAARAYLQVNCGSCHRQGGSASNSGLWFTPQWVNDPDSLPAAQWGLGKRPVAAGRGSGEREFVVKPGDPDGSIMPYRMASTEAGIAMPEVGRHLVHDDGLALIRQWISAMPANNQETLR